MKWLRELPARLIRYLRDARAELKRVVWPDRRQTTIYTIVVVVSVIAVAIVIWVVDAVLSEILKLLLFGAAGGT
ncbi:MAG: preprotein translocase subunit SecE [Bacillota bacterium]|jgi:preprotein translocase subunit SecE|nr:MAG: preprotein translocase subunit SecE [Bacillota bacterium]